MMNPVDQEDPMDNIEDLDANIDAGSGVSSVYVDDIACSNPVTPPAKTLVFAGQAQEHLDAAWKKYQKKLGSKSRADGDARSMSSRELAAQILPGYATIDAQVDAELTASVHTMFDAAFDEWANIGLEKSQLDEKTDIFLDIVQVSHQKVEQSVVQVSNQEVKQSFDQLREIDRASAVDDDPFKALDRC